MCQPYVLVSGITKKSLEILTWVFSYSTKHCQCYRSLNVFMSIYGWGNTINQLEKQIKNRIIIRIKKEVTNYVVADLGMR